MSFKMRSADFLQSPTEEKSTKNISYIAQSEFSDEGSCAASASLMVHDSKKHAQTEGSNPIRTKPTSINSYPRSSTNSARRRQRRFLVACGTVLLALTVIVSIIVYVILMTVKHKTQVHRIEIPNIH